MRSVTRIVIWSHRKRLGHHTRTFHQTSPTVVKCVNCGKAWRL